MFIQRTPRFGLAKVLGLVHVFLACVLLPLAVSDPHSATLADGYRAARRAPALSSRIIEESTRGDLLTEAHTVTRRRSHHHKPNEDENDVPRRVPAPPRRRIHYKRPYSHASSRRSGDKNVNINAFGGLDFLYNDKVVDSIIAAADETVEDDPTGIKLETKLYSSIKFRANLINVFGQILNAPNNTLTVDQFTSLNNILQALIHKQVYVYKMLPVLAKLQGTNEVTQFKLVMQALKNIVPAHITSSCKFWLDEIESQHVDLEKLIDSMKKPADFLMGIDPEAIEICKVKIANEELEPFDKASKVTRAALGPVFVNVFNKLKNHEMTLSQKLFGAILLSLPIGILNPVLEEYINHIWDLTQNDLIPNWEEIAAQVEYGTPYELVNFVLKKLLSREDTPDVLKYASKYILLHLKELPSTYTDENYTDMQIILNDDKNAERMFSMIYDDVAIPELAQMRDRVINYIKDMNVDDIWHGMNKYTYRKPIDALIALLARIQVRTQDKDISDTARRLLSILSSKKELGSSTVTVPADVDAMMLFEFLNVPTSNPVLSTLIQKIRRYLEGDLDLLAALQNFVLKEDKSKCHRPIQCLMYALKKIIDPGIAQMLKVPPTLLSMIEALVDLILKAISSSVKCESNDFTTVGRPQLLDLINVALKPITQVLGSTIPLKPPKPTEEQTVWPIPSLLSTDNDRIISGSDQPDPQGSQPVEILPTTYLNSSLRTPTTEDVTITDSSMVNPIQIKLPTVIRQPIWVVGPALTPRPTIETTPVPHIIQTLEPHVIPSMKPIIEASSPLPISSKEPPVSTSPVGLLLAQDSPVKDHMDNSSVQIDNGPVLPPNLRYDRPMYIVLPKDDTPPYTLPTKPRGTRDSANVIEFPPMKELLQGFDPQTPFESGEFPNIPKISDPMRKKLGPHFIKELLGKPVDKNEYPTVISLVDEVLDQALKHPKVKEDPRLVSIIRRYLKGIDYISTIALFPVVIDSKNISSDVVYVTFDPNNPKANSIDSKPPEEISAGFRTLAFYHPKYLVQQVDPSNPYGTLLPSPNEGEDSPIEELIHDGSLRKILGPEFNPLSNPNRGTLLTTLLWKLIVSQRIKSNPRLFEILSSYLKSIRSVALNSKIPNDYGTHFIELQENNDVNRQPDISNLVTALSPARTKQESNTMAMITSFLKMPNLLQLLKIDKPSDTITRGELLAMIFNAALQNKNMTLDPKVVAAIKYYRSRILTKGSGALPVDWAPVEMYIVHEEVPLGEIIELLIDYDSLPSELMNSYNKLMTYLSENPQLLQGDNFEFEKYDTKGTFLKGLFKHFLTKPDVSPEAKKYLKQLIPHVKLTGHGAEPMDRVTIDDVTKRTNR